MRATIFRGLLGATLALLLAACATTQPVKISSGGAGLPPPSAADTNADANVFTYRVGAGDVLQISVFGVSDLDRTVRVNSDGDISIPLIGAVHASGHTIPQLQDIIAAKLKKGFLQDPQVSVFVKDFVSQQVTVNGAVTKPGIYPLTGKTSLLQVLALAGGLTPLAQNKGVVIFRQIDGKKMGAVFDMNRIRTGKATDPEVYAGDIVVVAHSGGKSAWQNFIKSVPVVGLFFLAF